MERTTEFERRAFDAAGPVFLVALGALLLMVWIFLLIASGPAAAVTLTFLVVGASILVVGLLWGAAKNRRSTSG